MIVIFKQRLCQISMILNEQLIEDMFKDESVNDSQAQHLQEVSLNFTVSSRSTKEQKKEVVDGSMGVRMPGDLNVIKMATGQLQKFDQWLLQSESRFQQNYSTIDTLLGQLQDSHYENVSQDEIAAIKQQIIKKQNEYNREHACEQCSILKEKIKGMEKTAEEQRIVVERYEEKIKAISLQKEVSKIKDQLVDQVQLNMLQMEVQQLQNQITTLKNQKMNLERTYLFNKTRNEEMQFKMQMQKSKGLSAAKNSTNSSQLLTKNETLIFLDPIESDVDEWTKFFEHQKNQYKHKCKELQRRQQLNSSFTKQQRLLLRTEGKAFIIYSAIKQICKNLSKIRQHTNSFMATDSRTFLKSKTLTNDTQQVSVKEQMEKLKAKMLKVSKINQYLLCQKRNLEQISDDLKRQTRKQNLTKNRIEEQLSQSKSSLLAIQVRMKESQQENGKLRVLLEGKELQLRRYRKTIEGKIGKTNRSHSSKVQLA